MTRSIFALSYDALHKESDYIELAQEKPEFESACAVSDNDSHMSQSGVLIAADVVATAAHGMEAAIKTLPHQINKGIVKIATPSMKVIFVGGKSQTIDVEYVLLDARYFQNLGTRESKFDFAFLKLKHTAVGIEPAALFDSESIPNDAVLTVVSHGMSDASMFNMSLMKRAFRLYERDFYYGNSHDDDILKNHRVTQESSIYFEPLTDISTPLPTASENVMRSFEATKNWIKDGKKPYALALPGTSGAPVFVRLNKDGKEKEYVFGLVNSFSSLSGMFHGKESKEHQYILGNKKKALGAYQTIFCPMYKNVQSLENTRSKTYERDPIVFVLISSLKK